MRSLLLTGPLAILTALYLYFIGDFVVSRSEYHFGTEVGGAMYRTPWHYIGINLFFTIVGALALFAPKIGILNKHPNTVRVVALLLLSGELVRAMLAVK